VGWGLGHLSLGLRALALGFERERDDETATNNLQQPDTTVLKQHNTIRDNTIFHFIKRGVA
jgi:hypothetical protein